MLRRLRLLIFFFSEEVDTVERQFCMKIKLTNFFSPNVLCDPINALLFFKLLLKFNDYLVNA